MLSVVLNGCDLKNLYPYSIECIANKSGIRIYHLTNKNLVTNSDDLYVDTIQILFEVQELHH